MADELDVYSHHVIRVVLGTHPAMLAKVADPVGLECLCRRLSEAERALDLLCKNGYSGQPLSDLVRTLLQRGKDSST